MASFFSLGGKLWLIVGYNGNDVATWCYRCFEIALSGDSATENTSVIPAGLKVAPGVGIHRRVWEAIDDAGSARQVFIGVYNASPGTLDVYEFDSEISAWSLVANVGSPVNGTPIFWDTSTTSCTIRSAADSSPSSYASVVHTVSERTANGSVDVDIRYKDTLDTSGDPPWSACTNKTGQGEGKTSLSSKPAGITLSTHLSDDFADGVLNTNLWERCNEHIAWTATGHGIATPQWQNISEEGGMLRLGGDSPAPTLIATAGIGVRSKWLLGGDFQVDAEVELTNLRAGTIGLYALVFMAKVGYSQAYGVRIWINSVGSVNSCEGFTIAPNGIPSVSATSTAFANGVTFRIGRAAGTWSLRLDPAGANTDLLPAAKPTYNEDAQLYLVLRSASGSTNPATGTPGPGWRGFTVNSGTLGRYQGTMDHTFAWDHITDVGAAVSKSYVLFGDTN